MRKNGCSAESKAKIVENNVSFEMRMVYQRYCFALGLTAIAQDRMAQASHHFLFKLGTRTLESSYEHENSQFSQ